jgi:hypothetical protein
MYQRTNSVIPLSLFRLTFETANTRIVQRTQEGVSLVEGRVLPVGLVPCTQVTILDRKHCGVSREPLRKLGAIMVDHHWRPQAQRS